MDRFLLGQEIVKQIGINYKMAIVWQKKYINYFTETVVQNRGGNCKLFGDTKNTLNWLISKHYTK